MKVYLYICFPISVRFLPFLLWISPVRVGITKKRAFSYRYRSRRPHTALLGQVDAELVPLLPEVADALDWACA